MSDLPLLDHAWIVTPGSAPRHVKQPREALALAKHRRSQIAIFAPDAMAQLDTGDVTNPDYWRRVGEREVRRFLKSRPGPARWGDDPATAMACLFIFGLFTHHWMRPPGTSEATALCCGIISRGVDDADIRNPNPTCKGCQAQLAKNGVFHPPEGETP